MRKAKFRRSVVLIFVLTAIAGNAQKVDPRANIDWTLTKGSGTPTAFGLSCTSANHNQPFTNKYVCGADGWELQSNGNPGLTSDGSSGLAVTSKVTAATIHADVNSQINVMSYGARGDCSTDDHDAIMAAQAAALAYRSGTSGAAALYFPKPPGGCYVTSTIQWQGVSLVGQPSGSGSVTGAQFGVTLKGEPGQDILHVPDPTTNTFMWINSWSIRDISFMVDNSACAIDSLTCRRGSSPVFSNRYIGRWFDDGAMTSGSNVFTSYNSNIGCGDIGQAIQVNGAGPGGGNLVTKIANVVPCWANGAVSVRRAWQTVTLGANASTTVSNAHSYISLIGMPVTAKVGNCAIAMDDADGKPADWVNPSQAIGSYASIIDNTTFSYAGTNYTNSVCAIYTQGAHILYKITVNHFGVNSSYGIIQGTAVTNSYYASSSGDFEIWENGFLQTYNPWISYNGIDNTLQNIELNGDSGPQILEDNNIAADVPSGWTINIPEFENTLSGGTAYGMRIAGTGHKLVGASFVDWGTPSMMGVLDTQNTSGDAQGRLYLYGSGNNLSNFEGTATDQGRANIVVSAPDIASPPGNTPPTNVYTSSVLKNNSSLIGSYSHYPDFLSDGNVSVPYRHTDMWLTPRDLVPSGSGYNNSVVTDSSSLFGEDMVWGAGASLESWTQFLSGGATRHMVVGTFVPAGPVTIYASLKCASASSMFHFHVNTAGTGGRVVGGSNTVNCGTSFSTIVVSANLAGQTGNYVQFINDNSSASNPAWLQWIYVQPRQGLNGIPGVGSGAAIPSGPATSIANDLVVYAGSDATQADASTGSSTIKVSKTMGNGVPVFLFNNNFAAGSGQYDTLMQLFAPNATSGSHIQGPTFGYGNSANNEVHMQLDFSGAGSPSNVVSLISYLTTIYTCNLSAGTCSFPHAVSLATGSTMNSQAIATTNQLPLSETSSRIGGSALTAGQCSTGAVRVTGATTSMVVAVSPADGTSPGAGYVWQGQVTSSNTVTVSVCAIAAGTPTPTKYNVRVIR